MNGGEAIGSGGFGCVFHPALDCKTDSKIIDKSNYVSKLMINKHANEEHNIISNINKQLQTIPNHSNYFLTDNITKCKVKRLTQKDLKGYTKKCKPLIKNKITMKNINKKLKKISAIVLPHGGIDIDKYIFKYINNYDKMYKMFKSMIELIKNGIIPMNKHNIYHGDLKASNLMIKSSNIKVIDWGLAFVHKSGNINSMACSRPFQFNLPFSCVLINEYFKKDYDEYLDTNSQPSKSELKILISDFVQRWNDYRSTGSLDLMHYIYVGLLNNNSSPEMFQHKVDPIMIDYLVDGVHAYTKNGKFLQKEYYEKLYLHNLDLWGTIMSMMPIFHLLSTNITLLNNTENSVLKIMHELFQYSLDNSDTPMSSQFIVNKLQDISGLYNVKKQKMLKTTNRTSIKKISTRKKVSSILKQTISSSKSISKKNKTRRKYF